ncbi:hypothetical protein DFH94DRAFT_746916 [Russula ochroleuca]|uniref:Uncharacterized protein n=1 Tax=Russula ochroleuca TaxID=152965 RepID=A0A9P5MUN0_9AGAM|nr:hypothetical protein DFH94DRAFT_746916 [Russula ochroleuca]
MNRLAPVLYIRSTLASSRADLSSTQSSGTTEVLSDASSEKTRVSQDGTLEKPEHPMAAGALESESESAALPVTINEPRTPPPARTSLFASDSTNGPFRFVEPSGKTPTHVEDDPFDSVVMESISVGLVPMHMPRLTDPIALCTGFSMQAEVVKHASKFAEFRKARRKAYPERESKAEESEGGLFFASRMLGRSPALNTSKECSSDNPPPRRPLFDYLGVDIPNVSIVIPGTEGSP